MSYFGLDELKMIHLELTSKCNALCPQCTRSIGGAEKNPNLELNDITLENFKKYIPVSVLKNLKTLLFNGNNGDPCTSNHLLNIVEYCRSINDDIKIFINTNGGMRSPAWWSKLATLLRGSSGSVQFGIDGDEETNSLYRVGVIWENLMKNVEAFLKAGGSAEWCFIVFKHNEHLVEKMKAKSKKLGFHSFTIKKTGRFSTQNIDDFVFYASPVFNKNKDFSHWLEAPHKAEYRNESVEINNKDISNYTAKYFEEKMISTLGQRHFETDDQVKEFHQSNNCEVDCVVKKHKSIYIDSNGYMWPCCWTAWPYYVFFEDTVALNTRENIDSSGGLELIDLNLYSMEKVFDGPFFTYIKDGVETGVDLERNLACSLTCGNCKNNINEEMGLSS
jgi:MoaA/NifB/PqqE/SkfB family radical SAM enzyme